MHLGLFVDAPHDGISLLKGQTRPCVLVLLVVTGSFHRRVAVAIEAERAEREAGMTRILQGLSRSLSPSQVVDGIVEELAATSGATAMRKPG